MVAFKHNANKKSNATTTTSKKGAKTMAKETVKETVKETAKDESFEELLESLKKASKKETAKEEIDGKDTEKKFLCVNPSTGKHYTFEEMFGAQRGMLTLRDTQVFESIVVDFFESVAKDFTSLLPQKCKELAISDVSNDEFPLVALAVSCHVANRFDTKSFILATLTMLCRFKGILVTGKGVGLYNKDFEKGCLALLDKHNAKVKDPKHVDWCGKVFRTPLQNRLGNEDFALCSLCNSAMCFDIRGKSKTKLLEQLKALLEYALSEDDQKSTTKKSVSVTTTKIGIESLGIVIDDPKPTRPEKATRPTAFTRPMGSKKGGK